MQSVEPMNGNHNADTTPRNAHSRSDAANDQQLPRPEMQNVPNEDHIHTGDLQQNCSGKEPADDFSRHTSPETDNSSYPNDEKDSPIASDGRTASGLHGEGSGYHTVSLKNIPERATHWDIVDAVRGGALVDVFLRARERTASVTFADAEAANAYLAYARRWNVYVLGKPVLNPMPYSGYQVFSNLFCLGSSVLERTSISFSCLPACSTIERSFTQSYYSWSAPEFDRIPDSR